MDKCTQQCFYDKTKANWIDHKHVYFTFKLPNFFPNFIIWEIVKIDKCWILYEFYNIKFDIVLINVYLILFKFQLKKS